MAWGDVHVEFDGKTLDASLEDGEVAALRAWIGALLGADHFNVLLGSGFSRAAALSCGAAGAVGMDPIALASAFAAKIDAHAAASARKMKRGAANIEDQFRSALQLVGGLQVQGDPAGEALAAELGAALTDLAKRVLAMEREIEAGYRAKPASVLPLIQFVLALTQRPPSRDRSHVFTTNYDRVIEFVCDLAGIRTLDRFVGALAPVFRASRLGVDLHYNPPGIRGEPRYLEGVARLTKLHGSIDWRTSGPSLRREALGFGSEDRHVSLTDAEAFGNLMIYPNPAKDVETLSYPYAELFRDFSAAICRPGTTLLTYGYGFGDDHINRVIADMCAAGSTHLLAVSFDDADGRIPDWLDAHVPPNQRTVIGGKGMATLSTFAKAWLPSPPLESIRARAAFMAPAAPVPSPPAAPGA